jgi:hypothetical protein
VGDGRAGELLTFFPMVLQDANLKLGCKSKDKDSLGTQHVAKATDLKFLSVTAGEGGNGGTCCPNPSAGGSASVSNKPSERSWQESNFRGGGGLVGVRNCIKLYLLNFHFYLAFSRVFYF